MQLCSKICNINWTKETLWKLLICNTLTLFFNPEERSDIFRMNLWSQRFSQNTNKKLSRFLPSLHRAEILTIFRLYFGRNDDFINSFWNCLTFSIYNPAVVIRTYVGILVCINSKLGCVRKICIVAKTVRCQLLFGSQLSLQVKDTKVLGRNVKIQ